ncbi:unnamed protein product [Cyclocybe aegerita]|uniref:F-box domain-containing protein n=1 Tax=Cyclocybe aegerita TaxID=1973307 RepID=A0A8S0VQP5_CYCAE|nr:unnamed protein product [Cyclocybe aegerita]
MNTRSKGTKKPPVQVAPKSAAAAPKKVKGGKRKAEETEVEVQSKKKKVKGNGGNALMDIMEMPLDILFEIFSRVNLADLLTLSRTSKVLRKTLMNRSSVTVWARVRATMPGLPECPDDLSEPQYAELLTGNKCSGCDGDEHQLRVIWGARVKYCDSCLYRISHQSLVGQYSQELKGLVPLVMLNPKKNPSGYSRYARPKDAKEFQIYWHSPTDRSWREEFAAFKTIEEREAWEKAKIVEQRAKNTHGDACAIWAARNKLRNKEPLNMGDRQGLVVEYVFNLGWADEYAMIPSIHSQPQYSEICLKACQKGTFGMRSERVYLLLINRMVPPDIPLSEALPKLEDHLEEVMEYRKSERITLEKATLYKQRLKVLRRAYASFVGLLPPEKTYPNTMEIYQFSSVEQLIKDIPPTVVFTEDTILCDLNFSGIVDAWRTKVKEELIDLIRHARGEKYEFDESTVLDLATTFFRCGNCIWGGKVTQYGIQGTDALTHKCSKSSSSVGSVVGKFDAEGQALKETLKEGVWNSDQEISFDENSRGIMAEVVKACGLDPLTTTAKEMEELDPLIECLDCNDECEGRAVMKWSFVPIHHRSSTKHYKYKPLPEGPIPTFAVVKGEDAARARTRMKEQHDRAKATFKGDDVQCNYCIYKNGDVDIVKDHLRKS